MRADCWVWARWHNSIYCFPWITQALPIPANKKVQEEQTCRLKQLVTRTLYINNPEVSPLINQALSFSSNIPQCTMHCGLDPYVQSRVWSTQGACGASSWVSPKGISFVSTKTIPRTKPVPSLAPDQNTHVDLGIYFTISPCSVV